MPWAQPADVHLHLHQLVIDNGHLPNGRISHRALRDFLHRVSILAIFDGDLSQKRPAEAEPNLVLALHNISGRPDKPADYCEHYPVRPLLCLLAGAAADLLHLLLHAKLIRDSRLPRGLLLREELHH